MNNQNKIRITDIAKKAGVSKGTVDRVLHKRGNVSRIAKEKVLEAMQELNYQPNLLASILAQNKTVRIAALFPNEHEDPFWKQPKSGIERALNFVKDFGISVDFFFFEDSNQSDFSKKGDEILKGKYDGALIVPISSNEAHQFLDKARIQNLKYILINTFLDRQDENFLCYIGQHSYGSGKLGGKLIDYALNEGDTAMILHLEKAVYNAQHLIDKERGFKDFFREKKDKNIRVISRGFENIFDKKKLLLFVKNTLQANPKTKGIFVTTSRAHYIAPILEELNRSDIKLVGFDLLEPNLKYLKEDKISFLINQNPLKQGYLGIINFFRFFIQKQDIATLQYLPLDVVVNENVEFYLENEEEKVALVL